MTRTEDDLSHDGAFSDVSTISTSPVAQENNGKYTSKNRLLSIFLLETILLEN